MENNQELRTVKVRLLLQMHCSFLSWILPTLARNNSKARRTTIPEFACEKITGVAHEKSQPVQSRQHSRVKRSRSGASHNMTHCLSGKAIEYSTFSENSACLKTPVPEIEWWIGQIKSDPRMHVCDARPILRWMLCFRQQSHWLMSSDEQEKT